jgi:hypothetical protein
MSWRSGIPIRERVFAHTTETDGSGITAAQGGFFCYFSCPSRKVKEKKIFSFPAIFSANKGYELPRKFYLLIRGDARKWLYLPFYISNILENHTIYLLNAAE